MNLDTVLTCLTTIIVALIPVIVAIFKGRKVQKQALLMLLQAQLTEIYYKYELQQEIPDYRFKNWKNLLKAYEALGGDDYIHTLDNKIDTWTIKPNE